MPRLEITPLDGYPDEIGRWLWALEEARRRTLRLVDDLDPAALDWEGPDGRENAIGSLLYHLAGVEMDWLFLDILGQAALPDDLQRLFPFPIAEDDGKRLRRVRGVPLNEHLERLHHTRARLLDAMRGMTVGEWRRVRPEPLAHKYDLSPEWAIFHLIEHEAGHALQISSLKARFARLHSA